MHCSDIVISVHFLKSLVVFAKGLKTTLLIHRVEPHGFERMGVARFIKEGEKQSCPVWAYCSFE